MCPRAQRDSGLNLPFSFTPIQLAVRGQCATITLEEAPRRVRMTCNTRRRTVTKGTHLLRSALLALLALAVISGGSLAAGDLFDDDYKDCPYKTRLRDGQIADLSVNRDSDDEDHVNVAWSATDPATWGLGPNAYRTSLVVILDDGDSNTETLSLGSRKTTFEGVETGREVQVQMAIVVDTADGKYLISDILEQSINQSLTEPNFYTGWNRITATTEPTPVDAAVTATHDGWQLSTASIDAGKMYYVGYNQNFANYKSDDSRLRTVPGTSRLRIGLAHSSEETPSDRDDVDFDAYIIRITDEDGDVVSEGDDVSTRQSAYGSITFLWDQDGDGTPDAATEVDSGEAFNNQLVVTGLFGATADANPFNTDTGLIGNYALSNVRIVKGDDISPAMHTATLGTAHAPSTGAGILAQPIGGASWLGVRHLVGGTEPAAGVAYYTGTPATVIGTVYAMPPHEHRDFPVDTLSTDTTYTITAWAINEDDEVISPTATLKVRPHDTARSIADPGTTNFNDYLTTITAAPAFNYVTTAFTVHE